MITKGLTSDHMKYCELPSCAKVGGGQGSGFNVKTLFSHKGVVTAG